MGRNSKLRSLGGEILNVIGCPTQVVVCVSAGYRHSAAVSEDGELYTWGEGDFGRLGKHQPLSYLTGYFPSKTIEQWPVYPRVSCGLVLASLYGRGLRL